MIQLKEDDFMWKMYKRYYQGAYFTPTPPHPKTLCNFFWKAVGGMWLKLFWDMTVFLPVAVFGVFAVLGWWGAPSPEAKVIDVGGLVCCLIMVASLVVIACVTIGRLLAWCERTHNEWLIVVLIAVAACCGIALALGGLYKAEGRPVWLLFIYGALTEIGIVAVILGIAFTMYWFNNDTGTGNVIKQYLRAVKNRVCPLIKVPGEEDVKSDSEQPKDNV